MGDVADVQRLARRIADFWDGGGGPCTHNQLYDLFDDVGLVEIDGADEVLQMGSKKDRVRSAILFAHQHGALQRLVAVLLEELHEHDFLNAEGNPNVAKSVERLTKALARLGWAVSDRGLLVGGASPSVADSPQSLLEVPVARDHIARLKDAVQREDVANMMGVAKELIETVVVIVLRDTGTDVDQDDLPKRAKEAQKALKLHGSVQDLDDSYAAGRVKRILSSLSSIAIATIELRNHLGTGHGRADRPDSLSVRHAKMTAGAAIVYSEMLLDTLQDPQAPWQQQPAGP